jgi:hypothetical protein
MRNRSMTIISRARQVKLHGYLASARISGAARLPETRCITAHADAFGSDCDGSLKPQT